MPNRAFDAIIFDHDGTLVDTEHSDFLAWEMLYNEYGVELSMEHWAAVSVGHMNGQGQLIAELGAHAEQTLLESALYERLEQFLPITLAQVQLMPGVAQTLPVLAGHDYPLAVATASDRSWIRRWLSHFSLESYFQVIATRDDVTHNKPAPDVYQFAARQLGVRPERCLVFEDSVAGLQSAKDAGMTVVAVPNQVTKSLDFSRADRVISSLSQVTPAWLETLGD